MGNNNNNLFNISSPVLSENQVNYIAKELPRGYVVSGMDENSVLITGPDDTVLEFTNDFIQSLYQDTILFSNISQSLGDIISYYNQAPPLLKLHTDKLLFEKGMGGLTSPDGEVHIGYDSLYEPGNNPYSTQATLYHEMAHNMENIDKIGNITQMSWFKRISDVEKSSGYANEVFNPSHSYWEDRYSENWAEAIKIVAMAKTNNGIAYVSDPQGTMHSKEVSYTEWKQTNPQLDKLATSVINSKNDDEFKEAIRQFVWNKKIK